MRALRPNPLLLAWSVLRARLVPPPAPSGQGSLDHRVLEPVLGALEAGGLEAAQTQRGTLEAYLAAMADIDPDTLSREAALAFWINLYNALAIERALRAHREGYDSVLRVPGAFHRPAVRIVGEVLSLDQIEHGKIRRFGDPRIHGALVCGTVSCPTLRPEPYRGEALDGQLDDQLRRFLEAGGARRREGRLVLSRIFLWYGADFVRPHRMPTLVPSRPARVVEALRPWLASELVAWAGEGPPISFAPYHWTLGCRVG